MPHFSLGQQLLIKIDQTYGGSTDRDIKGRQPEHTSAASGHSKNGEFKQPRDICKMMQQPASG